MDLHLSVVGVTEQEIGIVTEQEKILDWINQLMRNEMPQVMEQMIIAQEFNCKCMFGIGISFLVIACICGYIASFFNKMHKLEKEKLAERKEKFNICSCDTDLSNAKFGFTLGTVAFSVLGLIMFFDSIHTLIILDIAPKAWLLQHMIDMLSRV